MHTPVPWIGLAAIVAMFLLPHLDARGLFDGPRIIRHYPRRHLCTDCQAPWTPGHQCPGWLQAAAAEPAVPLTPPPPPAAKVDPPRPLRAQLTRPDPRALPQSRWPR